MNGRTWTEIDWQKVRDQRQYTESRDHSGNKHVIRLLCTSAILFDLFHNLSSDLLALVTAHRVNTETSAQTPSSEEYWSSVGPILTETVGHCFKVVRDAILYKSKAKQRIYKYSARLNCLKLKRCWRDRLSTVLLQSTRSQQYLNIDNPCPCVASMLVILIVFIHAQLYTKRSFKMDY